MDSESFPSDLVIPDSQPAATPIPPTRAESLLATFSDFRTELDSHYDRRERIVKLSRDVTALSKKLIFALHRVTNRPPHLVLQEAEQKMTELRALFAKLQVEVQGDNFWRYEKSVSPGIQEFLEGYTFHYYLLHHTIPSIQQCEASLYPNLTPLPAASTSDLSSTTGPASTSSQLLASHPSDPPIPMVQITVEDYLGGVADLTGELMRLAIGSIGSSLTLPGAGDKAHGGQSEKEGEGFKAVAGIDEIAVFVRGLKGEMDPLAPYARWLPKKLTVLDQSLSKIESASYALKIRGAEYAQSPEMMALFRKRLAADAIEA